MEATVQSRHGLGSDMRPSSYRRCRQSVPSSCLKRMQARLAVSGACLCAQICQSLLLCLTGAEIGGRVIRRVGVVVLHVASGFLAAVIYRVGRTWAGSFFLQEAVTVCGAGSAAVQVGVQGSDSGCVRTAALSTVWEKRWDGGCVCRAMLVSAGRRVSVSYQARSTLR